MNKIYRHSFTKTGFYLGKREITSYDLIKPYLYTTIGAVITLIFVYFSFSEKNMQNVKERQKIVLEISGK